MTVLKIIASAVTVLACGVLGLEYSKKFTMKERVISRFISFVALFETRTSYTLTPVEQITGEMCRDDSLPENIALFLNEEMSKQDNVCFNDCWNGAAQRWIREYAAKYLLDADDCRIIRFLLKDALEGDDAARKNAFRAARSGLEDRRLEAVKQRSKNQKLYGKLGFLIGAVIVVFFY